MYYTWAWTLGKFIKFTLLTYILRGKYYEYVHISQKVIHYSLSLFLSLPLSVSLLQCFCLYICIYIEDAFSTLDTSEFSRFCSVCATSPYISHTRETLSASNPDINHCHPLSSVLEYSLVRKHYYPLHLLWIDSLSSLLLF